MKEGASLEIILEIEAYALKDLDDVATQLLMKLPDNGVVALHGAMGVGKTTLVKTLCSMLGVVDEVSSPTYGLVNVYEIPGKDPASSRTIHHIDLYRLKDEEEAQEAGVFDAFEQQGLSFVEWPERISRSLPDHVWLIKIEESMSETSDETSDAKRRLTLLRQIRS
jgi:tRNA threonylcarbamoyladenosine biosynthesis protein TsaE